MKNKNLTTQQDRFCKEYASGKSAVESYKQAYNCQSKNYNTIAALSNQLLKKDFIKVEIEKRREKNTSFLNYTAEKSFNKIKEIQEKAIEKGDLTNALKAEEMAGKLAGLFKQNTEIQGGILGDFKEFYAALCMKKDYGNEKSALIQSKTDDLSNCPNGKTIEIKQ